MRKYKGRATVEGFAKAHPIDYSDWKNSIALFGDSTTWGHSLQEQEMLHNIIDTDRHVNNFAYPGESNSHILMRLLDQINEYGFPYCIVVGWTSPYRMAHFTKDNVESPPTNIQWQRDMVVPHKKQFEGYNEVIMESVRAICKDKVKLLEWTIFGYNPNILTWETKLEDHGADKLHPGPKTMKQIARKIKENL